MQGLFLPFCWNSRPGWCEVFGAKHLNVVWFKASNGAYCAAQCPIPAKMSTGHLNPSSSFVVVPAPPAGSHDATEPMTSYLSYLIKINAQLCKCICIKCVCVNAYGEMHMSKCICIYTYFKLKLIQMY